MQAQHANASSRSCKLNSQMQITQQAAETQSKMALTMTAEVSNLHIQKMQMEAQS